MAVNGANSVRFGGEFELDRLAFELRRAGKPLKLERLPMELLLLLIERKGQLITRDEIVLRVWGKDVFVDTDNSINAAIRKIRQVLNDDPEEPSYVQTVTGRGYRFIAAVEEVGSPVNATGIDANQIDGVRIGTATAAVKPRHWSHSYNAAGLLLLAAAVLALVAVTYVGTRNRAGDATRPKITSLAVLPLKNLSGDPSQDYLADGMTESLVGRLAGIRNLRVISRTSVMRFKDTQLSVPEIARTLRVDAIVEGSVIREGSRIRVHAQLIRAATDEHFWSETYDRELRDVLSLESEVAQSIATKVEVTITGKEHARLTAVRVVSPEVYESYLKGRFALAKSNTRAQTEQSIGYFEEAIQRDPAFAPAYLGLAKAYGDLDTIFMGASPETVRPKIMTAIRKALELDPESAEAHILLADMQQEQWQWAEAGAEYKRALDLNSNDASVQLGLAQWLLCQGRTDEALALAQRARELDPLAVSGQEVGWILFSARRYDEAIREFSSVLAVRPDDAGALWDLGFALNAKGQPEKAIPVLEKAASVSNRSPGVIGVLVRAYAHAGRRPDALRLLAELKTRKQAGYVPAAAFVHAYLGLGENDQAFAWLDQAYAEHSNILQYVKVHPYFDPLRSDPRFEELVRRVGLGKS